MENFLAYISPRGDRDETLDLRELAEELAALLVAPARKQQAQVESELPDGPVPVDGNRYLLRQALLHLALAALTGVPRQGRSTCCWSAATAAPGCACTAWRGADSPAEADAAQPEPPAPGFELSVSAGGALAQLWVARAILAALGGEARAAGPGRGGTTGGSRAYEVELTISENPGNGNKGVR